MNNITCEKKKKKEGKRKVQLGSFANRNYQTCFVTDYFDKHAV